MASKSELNSMLEIVTQAVKAEREACARLCEESANHLVTCPKSAETDAVVSALQKQAALIRARKQDGW